MNYKHRSSPPTGCLRGPLTIFKPIPLGPSLTFGPSCSDFWIPSACMNTVVKHSSRNAMFLRDLCPRPAVWSAMHDASVPCLRFLVGPDAVGWSVPLQTVNTLNAQIVRISMRQCPIPEYFENAPCITDSDAFAVVIDPAWMVASSMHAFEYGVEAGASHSMRFLTSPNRCSRTLAATRDAFSVSQVGAEYSPLRAAGATTCPQSTATLCIASLLQNKPFSKGLSIHGDKAWVWCHMNTSTQ